MSQFLPFIVSGIATGTVYGLAATGLTLTYRTSGIFNFGYGALATAAAYLFYFLHVDRGLPWVPAALIVLVIGGPTMGLVMEQITRKLAPQRTAWKIIGTVGLILVVQGIGAITYGTDTQIVDQFLPLGNQSFRIAGVNVLYPQLWVTLISIIVVLGLGLVLRHSTLGVSVQAIVDDPDLVAMQAMNPARIRRISTIAGACLAALSGMLILPFLGLNSIGLTFLLVQAFGAAAVGRFASLPLTFVGAVIIGVVSNVVVKFVVGHSSLAGLPNSVPLIVLFGVLLFTPARNLGQRPATEARQRIPWVAPTDLRVLTALIVVAALALVPLLVPASKLPFFTIGLTEAIMLLSLGLLAKTSGQVSLCHAAFAAVGAVAFSQFAVEKGLPWGMALLLGSLIVVPIAALVAITAIRLSGIFLALATFGFGIVMQQMFFARDFMFTTLSAGREMPRPDFATSDRSYYYLVLLFAVAIAAVVLMIQRARLGRMLQGLSEAPVAIATMGLSTNVTKVVVFSISGLLAGAAGILYGGTVHFASSGDARFSFLTSLTLLAILGLAPFGTPWFALFGLVGAVIPGFLSGAETSYWLNVVFGLFAVLIACSGGPHTMPPAGQRFLLKLSSKARRVAAVESPTGPARRPTPERSGTQAAAPGAPAAASGARLEVFGLTVRFGGLLALSDVSFAAPAGRITGIIGPNGAGKTTLFDACSGLNRRVDGEMLLNGQAVQRRGPAHRARMGLGRTFQQMHLADSLTVAENVAMGAEAPLAGARLSSQLAATRPQRRYVDAAVGEALDICGIGNLARAQAGSLSTGQRRLVELARCLAGGFDLMLLDEPSSGLDAQETEQLGAVLEQIRVERGCGILLVEHDMSLVMGICPYIYVLDLGKSIYEGSNAEVASSPIVREAYLGSALGEQSPVEGKL